jgi:hypothetical protein
MSYTIKIDFQDGNGQIDISSNVLMDSLKKSERMFSADLKPVMNTCEFVMIRRPSVFNSVLESEDDILIEIKQDDDFWFVGRVRKNSFTFNIATLAEPAKVECTDNTILLKKKITTTQQFAGYKVAQASKANSLFHSLIVQAGWDIDDTAASDINKTIDYLVTIENEQTYEQVISKLLFEFGYVYYQKPNGDIDVYNLFPVDTSTTDALQSSDDGNNILKNINIDLNDRNYEAVRLKYYTHETISGALVFSETTGGDSTFKANIPILAGEYWPADSDTISSYLEYSIADKEIITVTSPTVTIAASAYIQQQEFTNLYRRAKVSYRNTGASTYDINLFDITGNAIVKGDINITIREIVENTEKVSEYECQYITTEADAIILATGLSNFYRYGNKIITARSKDLFDIGAFVDVKEQYNLNFTIRCVIQEIHTNAFLEEYTYRCVPIEAYVAGDVTTTVIRNQPTPVNPGSVGNLLPDSTTYVTHTEAIEGFDAGGGTTTPTTPVISKYQGVFKGTHLQWDKQLDLTNFDRYEVQVSDDLSDWYSLGFDLTDWKDTIDESTEWPTEWLTHPVPHGGTPTAPTSLTLYYHVRRVTKEPQYSTWSTAVTVATSVIDTGDIAEDSIYANKIVASEINTLLLRATDSVIVGNAGDNDSPAEGDLRTRIDDEVIRVAEQYTGGAWSTVKGIVLGLLTSLIGARGLYHPEAIPASEEFFPNWNFEVFNFDSDYTNQYGSDTWTTKSEVALSASYYKFGSKSLFASGSTYPGYLRKATGGTIGNDQSCGVWFYLTEMTTSGTLFYFVDASNNNQIVVSCIVTGMRVAVRKNGGSYSYFDTEIEPTLNVWHYFSISYKASSDILYYTYDDNKFDSGAIGGTWGTGTFELVANTYNHYGSSTFITSYLDELCIAVNQYINPDLWIQHYNHNIPWTTTYSAADLIFRTNTNGRIIFDDQQTYPPTGLLHMIPEANRPSTWVLNGGAATTPTTVDFSAYVPKGVKALVLLVAIVFNGNAIADYVLAYARQNGSTETTDAKVRLASAERTNLPAGVYVANTTQKTVLCSNSGVIDYWISSANGGLYLNLLGFYY